ncbi:pilus assembly protein PilM [Candidatus Parcubacteria bacterium]|jgi:type IV pilus assembly protein PilM|nr:pilus assembly protein PilM [Candidatus Parcubacteria bacterium]MBT7228053.1 pilus assembly protein PilM [Candidatus Parcubacteria bacterium]
MALFSSSNSYLGIDIGTSSIKMVELENYKGQAKLKTYGYADIATNILKGNVEKNNELVADYINQIFRKSHSQTRQVVAALPTFSVFNFIINLPQMPKKDLSSAIKWEAKKFIPVPIEEMILDWKILNKKKTKGFKKDKKEEEQINFDEETNPEKITEPKKDEEPKKEKPLQSKGVDKNYRILLTAAPKNLVARYIDIFKRAKFNLLSLETEAFALSRSLIGNDRSTVMIVDIGATTADICVIEGGVPILNRGIDTGGEFITKNIMNSLNVNQERAEQFKRDFGLSASGNKNIPSVIQKSLNSIINEIKYVFELYQRQGNTKIEKIVLTGGSAFLPSLPQYLSELLDLTVLIGDPWDRIIYPMDLKPVLQEIGPRMAASVGLAMRDI